MILICSAVVEELDSLLADRSFQADDGLYRHLTLPLAAAPLGVGMAEFLLGFSRVARRCSLRGAVHIGTCGVYPGAAVRHPVGTLAMPGIARLGDGLAAAGRGYIPAPAAEWRSLAAGPWTTDCLSADTCLTLTAITADDDSARQIEAAYGAVFEQMECYGFALACRAAGIPGTAIYGVSNVVGRYGHEQWLANGRQVADAAGAVLREWLPVLVERRGSGWR